MTKDLTVSSSVKVFIGFSRAVDGCRRGVNRPVRFNELSLELPIRLAELKPDLLSLTNTMNIAIVVLFIQLKLESTDAFL